MTTQSGITIAGPNEPYAVSHEIHQPAHGTKQALVKSLFVGINPVEPFMQHTGMLIASFPAVIGSDVSGVVLEVGADCTKLKKGDYVFGCAPVGLNEFSPFQETFVADENWVFKKGENVGLEEACTIGAGVATAGLVLFDGQDVPIPAPGTKAKPKDEWVVVMGGSGSVGGYYTQLAGLAGYKVLASCSPSKATLAREAGAADTFNNRAAVEEQLAEIARITDGNFARVFDASAQAFGVSIKALQTVSKAAVKYFGTVDDWSEMKVPEPIKVYRVELGLLGRSANPLGKHVTEKVAELVAAFESAFDTGLLRPLDYHLLPGQGWETLIEGIAGFEAKKFSKKLVVKIQDE